MCVRVCAICVAPPSPGIHLHPRSMEKHKHWDAFKACIPHDAWVSCVCYLETLVPGMGW